MAPVPRGRSRSRGSLRWERTRPRAVPIAYFRRAGSLARSRATARAPHVPGRPTPGKLEPPTAPTARPRPLPDFGDPDRSRVDSPPHGRRGAQAAPPPPKRGRDDDSGLPLGLILVGLLAAYGLLFILFNSDQVDVSFVFFDAQILALVVALRITAGIGFAAGYSFREIRSAARPPLTPPSILRLDNKPRRRAVTCRRSTSRHGRQGARHALVVAVPPDGVRLAPGLDHRPPLRLHDRCAGLGPVRRDPPSSLA